MRSCLNTICFLIILGINTSVANTPPFVLSPIHDTTINEDNSLVFTTLGLFSDSTGIVIHDSVWASTPNVVIVRSMDNVTVKPLPNWNGQSLISISATDDSNATKIFSFRLTVFPVNDPPVAIKPINDTSIGNREVLKINAAGHFTDPEDSAILQYACITPAGVVSTVTGTAMQFFAEDFIDTAIIRIIAHDPSGDSCETSFRCFFNKPYPAGSPVCFQTRAKPIDAFSGYQILPYDDSSVAYFYLSNNSLYVEVYDKHFQKAGKRKIIATYAGIAGQGEVYPSIRIECVRVEGSKDFLISYEYGYLQNRNALECLFLVDSAFTEKGRFFSGSDYYYIGNLKALRSGNTVLICGMRPYPLNYHVLTGELFDLSMKKTGRVVLDSSRFFPDLVQIVPVADGYFAVMNEQVSNNTGTIPYIDPQYYNRITYKKLSCTHSELQPAQQLVPYENKNPSFPQNYFGGMSIVNHSKGFVLLYTKADVELGVEPGSSGISVKNIYSTDLDACIFDSAFAKKSEKICIDTGSAMIENRLGFCLWYNQKYRLDWFSGHYGPGDNVPYKTQSFTESLNSLSSMQKYIQGRGYFDLTYRYSRMGTSYGLGIQLDSAALRVRIMPLDSIFSRAPTIARGDDNKDVMRPCFTSNLHYGRVVIISNFNYPTVYSLYALNGRKVGQGGLSPSSPCIINLRNFSLGTYILNVADVFRRTLIIP